MSINLITNEYLEKRLVPESKELITSDTLKHAHIYTLAVTTDIDISALSVELNGTAELWIDYTNGSVTLGEWVWPDDDEPTSFESGKRYCIVLRNDGVKTLASVSYSYTSTL